MPFSTIAQLLSAGREADPAIGAPGRPYMTHGELRQHVDAVVDALNARGIGRHDRVALVLSNGPVAATAFLAVASGATAAPLNPAFGRDEIEFCLDDLDVDALVVAGGSCADAVAAARSLAVPVLELAADPEGPAGAFSFAEDAPGSSPADAESSPGDEATSRTDPGLGIDVVDPKMTLAQSGDVALLLHTSDTTSKPKVVPLTHGNVCASAFNVAETLRLAPEDRCLNVMPLFHIHGLVAALLATIGSGGSVFCTPGFNPLEFFRLLQEADPTWMTAVPTMYQAILTRAARNPAATTGGRLRFLRSASAALPPSVMEAAEAAFGVPLVEAYAMTEAAHQMTCNPLPPRPRKPGTVGPAAGPEVAIAGEDGRLLDVGEVGEIVVRGANVTSGYENDAAANAEAFFGDWFRTGDEGFLDVTGYLTITGRRKEIINRGGEKVSPAEVEVVLLQHDDVTEAVVFALPHDKLGEEVAAAVVLVEGAKADESLLRRFCGETLADFKVPRRIVIVAEVPKGSTGKVQRIGMASRLGLVRS